MYDNVYYISYTTMYNVYYNVYYISYTVMYNVYSAIYFSEIFCLHLRVERSHASILIIKKNVEVETYEKSAILRICSIFSVNAVPIKIQKRNK